MKSNVKTKIPRKKIRIPRKIKKEAKKIDRLIFQEYPVVVLQHGEYRAYAEENVKYVVRDGFKMNNITRKVIRLMINDDKKLLSVLAEKALLRSNLLGENIQTQSLLAENTTQSISRAILSQ